MKQWMNSKNYLMKKYQNYNLHINMRDFTEYIYITEAWANVKNYKKELQNLMDVYKKKVASEEKKKAKGSMHWYPGRKQPEEILGKYPMQIIIDKLGYEPKTLIKHVWGPDGPKDKNVKDLCDYGKYILKQIDDEKITLDDLITWWEEYDTEILKKNWHDPAWIIKHVDGVKLWDPFRPKDTYTIDGIMKKPAAILLYLNSDAHKWKLTQEEREDLNNFYADPVNEEALRTAFKGIRKKLEKLRPSFSSAVSKWMTELMGDVTIDGTSLQSLLNAEYEDSKKSYYSGSNYRTCKGSSIVGIIYKSLTELYGIEFWKTSETDEDGYTVTTHKVSKGEDDKLEQFINDAESMEITVDDKGTVGHDSSGVHNSSFFTDYNHAFTVTISRHGKDDFVKEFPKVCVGSDYYSGGWD